MNLDEEKKNYRKYGPFLVEKSFIINCLESQILLQIHEFLKFEI